MWGCIVGALCSCFHVRDVQHNADSSNSTSDDCLCPKCFFQKLKNKHGSIFSRAQTSTAITSPNHRLVSSNSGFPPHSSSDANQPHDEAIERQEKGTRRLRVQPEPNGLIDVQLNLKSMDGNTTFISEEQNCGPSASLLSSEVDGVAYIFPSPDDEDECPTCLEDYTEENPKIIAKCGHHYHLSCIYEWMERSEKCPTCGKLMLFDESC